MPLANGADVSIGGTHFWLDDTAEDPYLHDFIPLYTDNQKIVGLDAEVADPNVLVWTHDDFSGGAETKYYDESLPDTWWYGKCNPRIRGSITSPPDRSQATVTLTTTSPTEWYLTRVGGKVWAGVDRSVYYSSDSGATWAQHNSTSLFGSGYTINGMTHDGNFPWVSASNGTTRKVSRIDSTSASTTAVSDESSTARTYGMAMLEGKVYLWTGGHLFEYSAQDSLPISHTASNKVHSPFAESPSGTFYAGIAASESSVFYFLASSGTTNVYEYKFNAATAAFVGRPAWNPPQGFTCRQIAHSMGVIYLLGEYGDQVALFGMSVINREPLFLTYVGQIYGGNGTTLTPRALAASYGAQVTMAVSDSTNTYHFVYDAELDALSELDERTAASDGTTYAHTTIGNRRLSFSNTASTTGRINRWSQDFDTPTGGWTWISAAGHLGYPMDEKLLFGFEVVQDPSIAAGTVQVEYQIDESGSWVSAGTAVAGVKYTYFDVASSNVKFRTLRLRATGASGARMFSITARSYINAYQEVWKLKVRLNNQSPGMQYNRKAHQLRDDLLTLVRAGNSVTFKDGRAYPYRSDTANTGYTSHNVVVEFPRSQGAGILTRTGKGNFEGMAEIVLRSTGRT